MYNSKLIQIYTHLNKEEKTLFKKWVRSPAHNQHEELILLFDFIANKRKITKRVVLKEKVFEFIYPNTIYNDLRLRHLMTLGVKLLEEFVCFVMQKKERFWESKYLTLFYKERNMDKYLEQEYKKINQNQEQFPLKDEVYYYNQYEFGLEQFNYITLKDRMMSHKLEETLNAHAIVMTISVLKNALFVLSGDNISRVDNCEVFFLEEVLKQIEAGKYQNVLVIQFYFNAYKCAENNENDQYFFLLKNLLIKHSNILDAKWLKDCFYIALNYCIKKINNEKEKYFFFLEESMNLYKLGLEYKILLKNNFLSKYTYANIIKLSVCLGNITWGTIFIEKYKPFLKKRDQEDYYNFAQIILLYGQKKHTETLRLLNQTECNDWFLKLDLKLINAKVYYESNLFEQLEVFLTNFSSYLQRNPYKDYHCKEYKGNIKFIRKLLYLKTHDKVAVLKLKKEMEEARYPRNQVWLIAQINKLLK